MELLPDLSEFAWLIAALYGWYVPVLLVLTCPQLHLRQKLRWVPLCLLFSWLGYYLFKLKNPPAADMFANK